MSDEPGKGSTPPAPPPPGGTGTEPGTGTAAEAATPPAAAKAAEEPAWKKTLKDVPEEAQKAAEETAKGYGKFKKWVAGNTNLVAGTGAAVTAAGLLIPNQKAKNDDGTETEKWGTGKKAVVFAGGTATVLGVAAKPTWRRTIEIAEAVAAKGVEAAKGGAHVHV